MTTRPSYQESSSTHSSTPSHTASSPDASVERVSDSSTAKRNVTATASQLLTDTDQEEILHIDASFDMYAAPTVLHVPMNRLPTLGLILSEVPGTGQVFVKNCQEGTAVSKMNKWRSLTHPKFGGPIR